MKQVVFMLEKIRGIVTDIVKHNDKYNVVTLYTQQRGRMAFLIPVGKSKAGRMRNATVNLMAVLEADVNLRSNKELYTLRQVNPVRLWHNIYADPIKSSLLFFITEFCNRLLRQYPADEYLWAYIIDSLETLEKTSTKRIANFHIAFLIGLLDPAGIRPPATSWEPGERFDMLTGSMSDPKNPVFLRRTALLSEEESSRIPLLLRIHFSNMHKFRMSRNDRAEILAKILLYYSQHLPLGTEFKSLEVLQEIFS